MGYTQPGLAAQLPAEISLASADPGLRTGLGSWLRAPLAGCTPGVVREAAVVLGELAANAFHHAAPPYRVQVSRTADRYLIRLAVTDGSPGAADGWRLRRGLLVVRGMCPQWGVAPDRLAGVDGKTVWALLRVLVPPATGRCP